MEVIKSSLKGVVSKRVTSNVRHARRRRSNQLSLELTELLKYSKNATYETIISFLV